MSGIKLFSQWWIFSNTESMPQHTWKYTEIIVAIYIQYSSWLENNLNYFEIYQGITTWLSCKLQHESKKLL